MNGDYVMKFERTTAVYIINSKMQVLMLLHKKINVWLPPGGHVEDNELIHQAAEREVMEETGIEIEFIYNTGAVNDEYDSRAKILPEPLLVQLEDLGDHYHEDFIYLAKSINEDIANNEGHEIGWFDIKDALELEIFDNVRKHLYYIKGLYEEKC